MSSRLDEICLERIKEGTALHKAAHAIYSSIYNEAYIKGSVNKSNRIPIKL